MTKHIGPRCTRKQAKGGIGIGCNQYVTDLTQAPASAASMKILLVFNILPLANWKSSRSRNTINDKRSEADKCINDNRKTTRI